MSHTEQTDESGSPFTTVSEVDLSRRDQIKNWYEEWIGAPFRILWSDRRARVGLLILVFYLAMGLIGPHLVPKPSPNQVDRFILPFQTWKAPLGSGGLGYSLLSQIVYATPPMLIMISAGAAVSVGFGVTMGTVSGYKGGLTDRVFMTATDTMLAIPGLPLLIVIATILEPQNPAVLGIILSIDAWPGLARSIRSQVLTLRDESYIEASRAMNVSTNKIVAFDILPNILPYILISLSRAAIGIIYASVGLYFLGVLPFTTLNWGVILNQAFSTGTVMYSLDVTHWLLVPMFTIILLTYGLILFSQGTDRIFNPRVRARHSKTVESDETDAQMNAIAGEE